MKLHLKLPSVNWLACFARLKPRELARFFPSPIFYGLFMSLLVALGMNLSLKLYGQVRYQPVTQWTGEYLQSREGAAFIRMQLAGFQRSSRGRFISGNVIVQLRNQSNQLSYQFSQGLQPQGQPQFIWKLPVGNYQLERISLIDHEGRNRIWRGPSSQIFRVKPFSLSYFGNWTIRAGEGNSLSVDFAIDEPNYQHSFRHQTFTQLINALNGEPIQTLGGDSIIKQAKENFGTKSEARATFSTVRQISMIYQLNLGRFHRFNQAIVRTLNSQDVELRKCYAEQLELDETLGGQIRFRFMISSSNGVMDRLVYSGGDLKNEQVIRCLYLRLGQMQFPISSKLQGQINFQFSTK